MWSSSFVRIEHYQTLKIFINDDNHPLTHGDVIDLWLNNNEFRLYFINLLCDNNLAAFFWEMPPITTTTLDKTFECIINNAQSLVGIQADASAFGEYFDNSDEVISFYNPGKDALLVAPTPQPEISLTHYAHLASFMRHAPALQKHHLFQTLAITIKTLLSDQPLWISTSGLGVNWLHLRLDSYPKYYTFAPYQQADFYHS